MKMPNADVIALAEQASALVARHKQSLARNLALTRENAELIGANARLEQARASINDQLLAAVERSCSEANARNAALDLKGELASERTAALKELASMRATQRTITSAEAIAMARAAACRSESDEARSAAEVSAGEALELREQVLQVRTALHEAKAALTKERTRAADLAAQLSDADAATKMVLEQLSPAGRPYGGGVVDTKSSGVLLSSSTALVAAAAKAVDAAASSGLAGVSVSERAARPRRRPPQPQSSGCAFTATGTNWLCERSCGYKSSIYSEVVAHEAECTFHKESYALALASSPVTATSDIVDLPVVNREASAEMVEHERRVAELEQHLADTSLVCDALSKAAEEQEQSATGQVCSILHTCLNCAYENTNTRTVSAQFLSLSHSLSRTHSHNPS